MGLEHLQRAGILLPEEEWGRRPLEPMTNRPALLAVGVAALAALAFMLAGGGRALTWIGCGLYLATLVAFTILSLRAVEAQVARGRAGEDRSRASPGATS